MGKLNVLTGNTKLLKSFKGKRVGSVSRTPILQCPGAPKGGCKFGKYSCYCLKLGAMYPSLRKHWARMDAMGPLLWAHVNEAIKRQHVQVFRPFSSGGDFLNQFDYDMFVAMVRCNPKVKFYAYTKSLFIDLFTNKPKNLVIIQSAGGKYDHLIKRSRPVARVGGRARNASKDDSIAASGVNVALTAH